MTTFLTDDALTAEILKALYPDERLTDLQITTFIGERAGGGTRVAIACQGLQERGLIFSVNERFWQLTVRGRLQLKCAFCGKDKESCECPAPMVSEERKVN